MRSSIVFLGLAIFAFAYLHEANSTPVPAIDILDTLSRGIDWVKQAVKHPSKAKEDFLKNCVSEDISNAARAGLEKKVNEGWTKGLLESARKAVSKCIQKLEIYDKEGKLPPLSEKKALREAEENNEAEAQE